MEYTVKQVSKLSGVSVRTLHFYDERGLLRPAFVRRNGYRMYGKKELRRLQQILFFKELDFKLEAIKRMIDAPGFDQIEALRGHRKLLSLKRKRIDGLMQTVDKTITSMTKRTIMDDQELYGSFSKEEAEAYKKEARERWGNTKAYHQSQERVKKLTKEDWARIQKEGDDILRSIVASMDKGPASGEVQREIARHYESLKAFYDPGPEMYRGLGRMYAEDKRFAAYYEKYHKDLPGFMRDAMAAYADSIEGK